MCDFIKQKSTSTKLAFYYSFLLWEVIKNSSYLREYKSISLVLQPKSGVCVNISFYLFIFFWERTSISMPNLPRTENVIAKL